MSMIAKNRTKSTWTPLSNEDTNNKIFEERKVLITKWYFLTRLVNTDLVNKHIIKFLFTSFIHLETLNEEEEEETREPKKSVCQRVKWSSKEEAEIREYFKDNFETRTTPGKLECELAINKSKSKKGVLHRRNWETLKKKYEKWSHEQKKQVLEELILKSKMKQKEFIRDFVKDNIPALKRDFTRHLPRVISIYILSFLDPRSLSRCSQVCWYWKYLTELDQLWMPKCLRLGWTLPFMPSQYEMGVWKRNYLENIKALQIMNPKKHTRLDLSKIHIQSKKPPKDSKQRTAPWRGSDPVPKDTWRFNYLENDDVVENVKQQRKKKTFPHEGKEISQHARSKVKSGQNQHNAEVRKSHSYTNLRTTNHDYICDWEGFRAHTTMTQDPTMDVQRPTPVYSPPMPRSAKQKASARTPRDPPTTDLFPKQPWNVPKADSDDEL